MSATHSSILTALERHALEDPDKPAFVFVHETLDRFVLTRRQVWDYSRKFAAVLRRTGLRKGDVVCNTLPNSPQLLISQMGTFAAGCISMNIQGIMSDGTYLVSMLNRSRATAVILDKTNTFEILIPKLQNYDPQSGKVSCPDVPSLKYIILTYTSETGTDLMESLDKEETMVCEDLAPNDICLYMSSSGSTGVVKLMPFSSYTLLENGTQWLKAAGIKTNDIYLNDTDFEWIIGFPIYYLANGSTRVLLDKMKTGNANHTELQWQMAVKEKCTTLLTSTHFLTGLSKARMEFENKEMKNYKLRTISAGGSYISRTHMEGVLGELAEDVIITYGSTETGLTTSNRISSMDDFEEFNTGTAVSGTKVKIVDDDNQEVHRGRIGEIIVQTTQSCLHHYVDDPANSIKTFGTDGWIRTGDIGKINSKGQLQMLGRKKFAIRKCDTITSPDVIECYFRKCSGIKDVAVVSVPDAKMNEEICTFIIRQPGAELSVKELDIFCKEMMTPKFREDHGTIVTPKYYLFVDSFPLNHRNKLDRIKLKKLACEALDL